ncbi:aminotransferase class I/II-fold pyridoxal phosphate-dependent enzyme [Kitasatospora sp. NBC_01266]|uniref:aminotransferase class I/II-fold pyridoxal phosphate-dependent enzyme n=1 Tax=Kitasatospora sp. NBC_01266 TaxID=2903572 RepID=UPI002E33ABEE|nr:aminotransferase class I/II-fold pyridoxal phosphate-dependent enzyme [Kitasatospora sp. NBC_01266]
MVSRTAAALVAAAPAIAEAHFSAEAHPYHPTRAPGGYLNLGTAENRLLGDLLTELAAQAPPFTAADTRYAPLHGTPALRERIAELLSTGYRAPVDPEHLVLVSGATAALDVIASALCDPGEAIVLPAPYYGAFDTDLGGRSGARLIPVPLAADDGFALRTGPVEEALHRARRAGVTVRAIALASPSNPLGQVHPASRLRELASLAAAHGVDLIGDQIYAHSVFGAEPFTALEAVGGARLHTVWGFAKDFGLPGYKVGVLHTTDPEVLAAARALAYFAPVSTGTQAFLAQLLADPGRTAGFLTESRRRLAASYTAAAAELDRHGLRHLPAEAGCSLWLDLRDRLPEPGFDGERRLWRTVFDRLKVNIMPGEAFHSPEPGWFRLCHPLDPAVVAEAVARLATLPRPADRAGLLERTPS